MHCLKQSRCRFEFRWNWCVRRLTVRFRPTPAKGKSSKDIMKRCPGRSDRCQPVSARSRCVCSPKVRSPVAVAVRPLELRRQGKRCLGGLTGASSSPNNPHITPPEPGRNDLKTREINSPSPSRQIIYDAPPRHIPASFIRKLLHKQIQLCDAFQTRRERAASFLPEK